MQKTKAVVIIFCLSLGLFHHGQSGTAPPQYFAQQTFFCFLLHQGTEFGCTVYVLGLNLSHSEKPKFQNFPSRTQPWWVLLEASRHQPPKRKFVPPPMRQCHRSLIFLIQCQTAYILAIDILTLKQSAKNGVVYWKTKTINLPRCLAF